MTIETLFLHPASNKYVMSPVKPFTFPAGEQSIKFDSPDDLRGEHLAIVRGANANDLVTLRMWSHTIRMNGGNPRALIPYLPGARDDKDTRMGSEIYSDMINSCALDQMVCLDPHSVVMPNMIQECRVLYGIPLIERAIKARGLDVAGVIIPDEGAITRSTHFADRLGVPTYQAHKKRNPDTGALSGFECEPLPDEGLMLVSDDICDGGGTFVGLAEATDLPKSRLALWVTHGVFSKKPGHHGVWNLTALQNRYDTIMTTDSYPSIVLATPHHIEPCIDYMIEHLDNKGTK